MGEWESRREGEANPNSGDNASLSKTAIIGPVFDFQRKIEWGEKRIGELKRAIVSFKNTNPYGVSVKPDPKTRETIYYLSQVKDIPSDISLIAGDVLQNLRSSLDYLAVALVRANGEAPTLTTGFPISERLPTTADERRAFTRKVNGMAQDAIDFIRAMKPYKGGDDVLWRLHRLNAIDKHRFLFTAGAAIRAFNAGQHLKATAPPVPELRNVAESLTDYWVGMNKINFPLKAGDVLLRDFPDAPVNESIEFVCDIALNEPGVCAGELLLVVLRQSMNRVRQVTIEFAAFLQ